ncbi:unnamed protein product [Prunus armeniaca]
MAMETTENQPTQPVVETEPITFFHADTAGINFPHHDPLVITVEIARCEVARVFMDRGSSVNIIFLGAFKQLGISENLLDRRCPTLVAFGGGHVLPLGHTHLTLSIGVHPKVRGDQDSARTCYASSVKLKTKVTYEAFSVETCDDADLDGSSMVTDSRGEISSVNPQSAPSDVFTWSHEDRRGINPDVITHCLSIDPQHRRVRQKRRAYDAVRYAAMKAEVDKLQKNHFMRLVDYPRWLTNAIMVQKTEDKWQMCVDFTNLNKACPKDSFPLPRIDQLVDAMAGHELLSFMDAYSGYNQIRMHTANQESTYFITDWGTYCYQVMPFGLTNTRATYQRLVNHMFSNQIGKSMEVYVDDMLVKSVRADQHVANLAETFAILHSYDMKLNPAKCVFGVGSGKMLEFLVSHRGIEANPEKIQALVGRVAALNQFISKATDQCLPFFKSLKGNKKMVDWTPECAFAFEKLKEHMGQAPILSKPEVGDVLSLYLSVFASVISSVLTRDQERVQHPVYYVSKVQLDTETRLVLRKLETSGCLVKWSIELGEFDITYLPHTAMKAQAVADFISEFTQSPYDEIPRALEPTSTPALAQLGNDENVDPTGPQWTLYVDGASNLQGYDAGLVLISPSGVTVEYALRFRLQASNNEAEYEALLAGLCLAKELGAEHINIPSDSQLIPRTQNTRADSLARLASGLDTELTRNIPIEYLVEISIDWMDCTSLAVDKAATWMTPIWAFLTSGTLLSRPRPRGRWKSRARCMRK